MLPYTITWSPGPSTLLLPASSMSAPIFNENLASLAEPTFTSDEMKESNLIPNVTYPSDQIARSADQPALNEHSLSSLSTASPNEPARAGFRKRKGHRKSHNGCLQCKRRKIKCQENYPTCHNCLRGNGECIWPEGSSNGRVRGGGKDGGRDGGLELEGSGLQATPTRFDAEDMRLFHHFLINAYPHLPLGCEGVWVRDVPGFAHSYPYLLHSLLALSASHLHMLTPPSQSLTSRTLSTTALKHRILAIHGLNEALSSHSPSSENSLESGRREDRDIKIATCYALAFQSSYQGVDIVEFLIFLRGVGLVGGRKMTGAPKGNGGFRVWERDQEGEMGRRLEGATLLDPTLVTEVRESVRDLEGLEMGLTEKAILDNLIKILDALLVSSRDGYFYHLSLYGYLAALPHDAFRTFIEPSNVPAQLLLAHFVAILVLIMPLKSVEWKGRQMGIPVGRKTVFGLEGIRENVRRYGGGEMETLMGWCLEATGSVEGKICLVERMRGYMGGEEVT